MADRSGIDASIPLQAKRPDMMGRISDMLSVQAQQSGLQQQRAQTQMTEQTAQQRKGIADFDVSKIIGDDGTIDLNKVPGSGLREAAGDQFPEVLQQFMSVRQQQIAAKQSLVQLGDAQRQTFGEMIGALGSDPDVAQDSPAGREKVAQSFAQYAQMFPDAQNVLKAYAGPLQKAPPGKLGQVVKNIQLQATSAADQASRQTPNYAYQNTGSELRRLQTNPNAPGGADVPERMQLGISPGEQSSVMTDQLANPFEVRRDQRGNIVGARPLEGPARFGPGEKMSIEQQAEQNFQNVNATRIAAQLAPQQIDQINKALELSKSVATGGNWAQKRANLEATAAAIIPGLDAASDDATKLQLLDKFAERIAADSARVLGANAGTDAARESIHRQNANIGYTPKAVQEVLKYAKAQTEAMGAKGDAQESWLKRDGNGITKQHEFETEWRQAYDPIIFQLRVADPKERDAILDKLPKAEQGKLKSKYDKLKELGAIK